MVVIAPNSGSITEFISDGYIGLVVYEFEKQIIEILKDLDFEDYSSSRHARALHNRVVSENRISKSQDFNEL
jgi:hypothetical protein